MQGKFGQEMNVVNAESGWREGWTHQVEMIMKGQMPADDTGSCREGLVRYSCRV